MKGKNSAFFVRKPKFKRQSEQILMWNLEKRSGKVRRAIIKRL